MKNRVLKAVLAVSAIALGTSTAHAATASADAKATILAPIAVTKASDLNFGTIAVNAGGNAVISQTSDAVSCGAATGIICAGATSRAKFDVTGAGNAALNVTVDPNVTLNSGSNSMTAVLDGPTSATLASGAVSFYVGGDLTVAGGQAAGAYVGTFDVEVTYQ
jgi:hypothetical protein